MQTWGVAALADEPGSLVAAFAAFHLAQGAAEVHICLDRPNPEAQDLLQGVPGVFLHAAGADGWAFNGGGARPARHLARQKYHASRILAETGLDWLIHCDIDEFVLPEPGHRVAEVLSATAPEAAFVRIPVAERVSIGAAGQGLFAGSYRLNWRGFRAQGPRIYDEAQMLLLHHGLAGHHIGKSATRAGLGLYSGIHQPMREYGGGGRDLPSGATPGLRLLHYDGLTELHYALKMLRRALALRVKAPPHHAPHRLLQIEALAGARGSLAGIRAQWRATKQVSPQQAQALRDLGVLIDLAPGIAEAAGRVLGQAPDLSAAAFDQALLEREAELIAEVCRVFGVDPTELRA